MNEIDKAERNQAWKAFLIPSSLFVACLFNAAGIYILYSGSAIGMVFLGLGIAIIFSGLFLAFTFQNKKRAAGQWKRVSNDDEETPSYEVREDYEEEAEDFSPDTTLTVQQSQTPVDVR